MSRAVAGYSRPQSKTKVGTSNANTPPMLTSSIMGNSAVGSA